MQLLGGDLSRSRLERLQQRHHLHVVRVWRVIIVRHTHYVVLLGCATLGGYGCARRLIDEAQPM